MIDLVVHKFKLNGSADLGEDFCVTIKGIFNKVAHVGYDATGDLCAWIILREDEKYPTDVYFRVVATGMPWPALSYSHEGTVVSNTGFVWHILRRKRD